MKGQDSWLWPHLKSVLEKHSQILASWRKQLPTQSGHTKNFENWILVEMVHSLIRTPGKKIVRTNGHFTDKKIKARDVKGLLSSKSKAKHLSADISVKYTEINRIVNAKSRRAYLRAKSWMI